MTIPRIASYPMPQAGSMPENRVDWRADKQRAVLLIHDMQQYFLDFFDPAAEPVTSLIAHIRQLRATCDALGVPVFYTAQPAQQNAEQRGLLQQWWGPGVTAAPQAAMLVEELQPKSGHVVLEKWRYSAFQKSDLLQRMRSLGRDQLIVCGVYAHIGCMLTVADAFMNDIQPFMVGDAIADFSEAQHKQALDYVAGRCGIVADSAAVIASLSKGMSNTLSAVCSSRSSIPHDLQALRSQVAALLQIPASDLHADENLLDAGLDSIRLMSLIEQWHRAGRTLGFAELAEQPTLEHWWRLLSSMRTN
ncbi:isochorismatase family protein [Herbaspirillum lusitanum]|uniref:isochorismatase n=1 Tax=Herbaspirillum lusitanum TaxID=213312 RepID=A0ABW9ACY0_9BURK